MIAIEFRCIPLACGLVRTIEWNEIYVLDAAKCIYALCCKFMTFSTAAVFHINWLFTTNARIDSL